MTSPRRVRGSRPHRRRSAPRMALDADTPAFPKSSPSRAFAGLVIEVHHDVRRRSRAEVPSCTGRVRKGTQKPPCDVECHAVDPRDRRAKLIVLTRKGQACVEAGQVTIEASKTKSPGDSASGGIGSSGECRVGRPHSEAAYRLGSDRGSPNHGSTLLSKRVMPHMRSPVRARTRRPVPWRMPVGARR